MAIERQSIREVLQSAQGKQQALREPRGRPRFDFLRKGGTLPPQPKTPPAAPEGPQTKENSVTPRAEKVALDYIQEIEGDVVDDPDDAGGHTRYGVTKRAWESYSDEDFEAVDRTKARQFFRDEYIRAPGIDQLPDGVGVMLASLSVNAGPQRAIKLLQDVAGVEQDGRLGPKTLEAAGRVKPEALKKRVDAYYQSIAKRGNNQKFLKGWLRRSREVFERAQELENSGLSEYIRRPE